MPQFGFRTGSFPGLTAEGAAGELARLGYDCLELCLEAPDVRHDLDEARCRALRAAFEQLGIAVASVSYHGDKDPLPARAANQEVAIRAAQWLGTGIAVLNTERAVERERQWAEHVSHLGRLCAVAEEAGVTLALEPEPLLVVGSSEDMAAMIEAVGSPRLRVNLDVGHAWITDEDVAASIRRLGERIVHLHLEDIGGRVHRHLPLGEGDIDFTAIREALGQVGYKGPYVVDLFGQSDAPSAVAGHALEGLRRLFG